MTLAATRQAISEALTSVAGVTGYERAPRSVKVFDAWPMWEGATSQDGRRYAVAFADTWRVYVVLPGDLDAADEWISTKVDALLEVLSPILAITAYAPARLTLDGSTAAHNALMISGETE